MNNTKDKNKKIAKILFTILFCAASGALAFVIFLSKILFVKSSFIFWLAITTPILVYIVAIAIAINFLQKLQYKAAIYYSSFCLLAAALFLLISLM